MSKHTKKYDPHTPQTQSYLTGFLKVLTAEGPKLDWIGKNPNKDGIITDSHGTKYIRLISGAVRRVSSKRQQHLLNPLCPQ